MKTIITIFVCIAAVSSELVVKTPEEVKAGRMKCLGETNVPENLIAEIKKFQYPNDPIIHKYILCVGKTLGYFDEKTGYIPELLAKIFEKEAEPIIKKCVSKNDEKSSTEEWAWRDWKCLVDNGALKPSQRESITDK